MTANVLIGFVTPSDPVSGQGLASIATAARALEPACIHLLFTEMTEHHCLLTEEKIREFAELRATTITKHMLPVGDARDVAVMVEALRCRLPIIRRERQGHFCLVSGHAAVRLAMALCVSAGLIDGVVYNIDEPENKNDVSRAKCVARLNVMDISVLHRFLKENAEHRAGARLKIDLEASQARLDQQPLELRSTTSEETGEPRHSAFDILAALAARRVYGAGDSTLTVAQLSQAAYNVRRGKTTNVWRRIDSLNRNAARITQRNANPIGTLVVHAGAGSKGIYRLTDDLDASIILFEQSGEHLALYLERMKLGSLPSLFPDLPRPTLPE